MCGKRYSRYWRPPDLVGNLQNLTTMASTSLSICTCVEKWERYLQGTLNSNNKISKPMGLWYQNVTITRHWKYRLYNQVLIHQPLVENILYTKLLDTRKTTQYRRSVGGSISAVFVPVIRVSSTADVINISKNNFMGCIPIKNIKFICYTRYTTDRIHLRNCRLNSSILPI
jgi:hypothetical protein